MLKMEEIGGEQLNKFSCNSDKTGTSEFFDSTNAGENVAKHIDRLSVGKGQGEKFNLQEGDGSKRPDQQEQSSVMASNMTGCEPGEAPARARLGSEDEGDEKEKADATPENLKKIDDVISTNYGCEGMQAGDELKIVEDESPTKQCLAFTIDFGGGEPAHSAAAAAKYKNIMERFQSRHKRGASLSKLDDQATPTTPVTTRTPRVVSAQSSRQPRSETTEAGKAKLRIRERSTSGVRDSSKRHSWSPRSSTHEAFEPARVPEKQQYQQQQQPKHPVSANVNKISPVIAKLNRPLVSSDCLAVVGTPAPVQMVRKNRLQYTKAEPNYTKAEPNSGFTPRSTAMQMALNRFEFLCPEPPLELKNTGDDGDCASDAGTYTLDGDNYTEEQKDLMNIDKTPGSNPDLSSTTDNMKEIGQVRPNELPLLSSSTDSRKRNNVLEISYYHDSTSVKPKVSYLEKIKSRVRSITKSPDKKLGSPSDMGTFTSVTTSGILSKKSTLDAHPRLNRRNSLTKSQIDSSEYVSTDSSLRSTGVVCPSTYTDHQKAEYKLNLFTNQGDFAVESPSTPNSPSNGYQKAKKVQTGLKTAQSKSDWIQEWARNARARNITKENCQMSRSYDCETAETVFSDSNYRNKHLDKFRTHRIGDIEYSSDTNVSRRPAPNDPVVSTRPPLSPSRIPSPMHSVGRARGSSRTRGSLQDLSPLNSGGPETDVYLQKTAAAISNLQQSLSRKNSLQSCKSPPSINDSPRRLYQQHYSADEYSPPHSGRNGIHKRNLSFDYRTNVMSQSLNNEALAGLAEYRSKSRPRQNSFDAAIDSPHRRSRQAYIDQTQASIKQQRHPQSPLRRSSSFSVKPMGPITGQKITPTCRTAQKPAHIVKAPQVVSKNLIQKSASSTSFRKMYSDYEDNVAYYINDEDDLVDDYCSSEEYEDREEFYTDRELDPEPEPEPITNTRYNKALLMRIERSKQKVAGMSQTKPTTAGLVACPNTPEMPRRSAQSAARSSMRQSVPRDSSLNRLRGEVPSSLASAKKQLLQTANTVATGKKVTPKYMDISKYKPAQGANFLRKDETKSTLVSKPEVRRSPSSASVVLNRSEPARTSNRSVKSAGSRPASSKRDASVTKQKEAELAMWKRRSTYDPMRAAAEGRRKQDETKKVVHPQSKPIESSVVLRSQSFHSGVGTLSGNRALHRPGGGRLSGSTATDGSDHSQRWTLTSTESSEEDEEGVFAPGNS